MRPRPENPYLRNTSIIEPGQVFTIEPGIYFIDFLMDELRQGEHGGKVDWKLADALAVLGGVVAGHQDVVQVNKSIWKVEEDAVHQPLERHAGVFQAERHTKKFEEAERRYHGSLVDVGGGEYQLFLHADRTEVRKVLVAVADRQGAGFRGGQTPVRGGHPGLPSARW